MIPSVSAVRLAWAAARPGSAPGDGLLHPVPIAAIIVLVANDHLFKTLWPGLVTGKLSDVAGLLFFPLLVQAGLEVGEELFRGTWRPSRTVLALTALATGAAFAGIKLWPAAGDTYRVVLGILGWPIQASIAVLAGSGVSSPSPVPLASDPTDLVALPFLIVSYLVGRNRRDRSCPDAVA